MSRNVGDNIDDVPVNDVPVKALSVVAIYTRGSVPRRDELPKHYNLGNVQKDQSMCRRRVQCSRSSNNRVRFVPEIGLLESDGSDPLFYHADVDEHDESDSEDESDDDEEEEEEEEEEEDRVYEERAILIQSVENYQKLLSEAAFSKLFQSSESCCSTDETTKDHRSQSTKSIMQDIIDNPRFGEQILVRGCDSADLAIGDVFEVANDQQDDDDGAGTMSDSERSTLQIEITSPRLCCAWVDKRMGSRYGLAGVKHYCNHHAVGGWFARVLKAGDLCDGMQLVRTAHPHHPKWTLPYVSQSLYTDNSHIRPFSFLARSWAFWTKSLPELQELCELEQLGRYEWKEEAEYIVKRWDKYFAKRRKMESKSPPPQPKPKGRRPPLAPSSSSVTTTSTMITVPSQTRLMNQMSERILSTTKTAMPDGHHRSAASILVGFLLSLCIWSMASASSPSLVELDSFTCWWDGKFLHVHSDCMHLY